MVGQFSHKVCDLLALPLEHTGGQQCEIVIRLHTIAGVFWFHVAVLYGA